MVFYQGLGGFEPSKLFDRGLFHDKFDLQLAYVCTRFTLTILSLMQQKTYQSVEYNQPFHNIARDWEVELHKCIKMRSKLYAWRKNNYFCYRFCRFSFSCVPKIPMSRDLCKIGARFQEGNSEATAI